MLSISLLFYGLKQNIVLELQALDKWVQSTDASYSPM